MNNKEIDFSGPTHRLEDLLFEVEELPVYTRPEPLNDFEIQLPGYKALFNVNAQYPLSVVSRNYELVTNEKAMELGKEVFCRLFPAVSKNELIPFKVIATLRRTACHIDLIHKDVNLNKWKQDTWLPFLRISNSYNRTVALSFQLGFVRSLCSNGFIFDKKSVKVKYSHTKGEIPHVIDVDVSTLRKYEVEFVEHLKNLSRFFVGEEYVFALVMKAVSQNFRTDHSNERTREAEGKKLENVRKIVNLLTMQYFANLGSTAYAVLNIVTDYISHQDKYKSIPLYISNVNSYYSKPGEWINDFSSAIEKRSFNFEDYLGDYISYLSEGER